MTVHSFTLPLPGVVAVNFAMAEQAVKESENSLRVCVGINAGPFTSDRTVPLRIFSVGDPTGALKKKHIHYTGFVVIKLWHQWHKC